MKSVLNNIAYWFVWKVAFKIPFWLGLLRVRIEGWENFPEEQNFILVPVHSSYIDTPLLASLVKRQIVVVSAKKIFDNWKFFGPLWGKFGWARPVGRLLWAIKLLREGHKVLLIYPEGGVRTAENRLTELGLGAFWLAEKTEKVIIPAVLEIPAGLWPRERRWPKLPCRERLLISFGPPLYPGDFTSKEETMKAWQKSIERLLSKQSN